MRYIELKKGTNTVLLQDENDCQYLAIDLSSQFGYVIMQLLDKWLSGKDETA